MKVHVRYWAFGGSIVLGAAAGYLIWLVTSTKPHAMDAEATAAPAADSPLVRREPKARALREVDLGPLDHGESREPPAPFPPPAGSQRDLGALLQAADSLEGESARRSLAARINAVRDESWRRVVEDPAAALAWALQQDGDMARVALQVVLGEWAQVDPAAAFAALGELSNTGAHSSLRAHGLALVAEAWAAIDPAAALQGVGTLSSSPGKALLQARVLALWSRDDPVTASMMIEPLIIERPNAGPEAGALESTVSNLAYRLAQQDGMAAATWALKFPDGSGARTSALAGAVSGWLDGDPQAVGAWLDAMEPGATRDAGVIFLVRAYATEAPDTALAWAQTISDKAQRSSLSATTAARWLSAEPEKAEAWIRTTTELTDGQRGAIFEARRHIPEP